MGKCLEISLDDKASRDFTAQVLFQEKDIDRKRRKKMKRHLKVINALCI
jgi:hypothetical protein